MSARALGRRSKLRVRSRRWLIKILSATHLALYRLSGGRVLARVAGMPVLLLTTTGRRTGRARTTPLTFFRTKGDLVVIASNGGADRPPDWFLNLQADPRALVRVGRERFPVSARTTTADERQRLWPSITTKHAGYARYQRKTNREIPVLLLTPEDGG